MSLAIHKWVGLEFDEYLDKIHSLLEKNGRVLIESHIIYQNKGDHIEPLLKKNQKFEIVEKGAIDDHDGQYREFFWLKSK
jgi:cyclopropane fatty-acyl-phospholipid synthase-like methyltransferase